MYENGKSAKSEDIVTNNKYSRCKFTITEMPCVVVCGPSDEGAKFASDYMDVAEFLEKEKENEKEVPPSPSPPPQQPPAKRRATRRK